MTGFPSDELAAAEFWPLLLVLVLRGALGALFLASAVSKIRNPATFRRTVRTYELVPRRAVAAVAHLVVASEVLLGLSLLAGFAKTVSLGAASAMLLVFATAITVNLLRGRSFDCGCYGLELRAPISWRHVVRNCGLGALAAIGAIVAPTDAGPLIPSLVLMSVGVAIPAVIASERRTRQLTPYPVGPALRAFVEVHAGPDPNGGVAPDRTPGMKPI